MTDFIVFRKSRNLFSGFIYFILNLLLGTLPVLLTTISGSWIIGLFFVLISKWRMFAVRPRYWLLNLKSNLVDLIVGSSFIFIAYSTGTNLTFTHLLLATLYPLWLIFIKPRSDFFSTNLQALISVFLGTTATVLLLTNSSPLFTCLSIFIIGYAASRHVIVQNSDHDFTFITLVFGLFFAELAWLTSHWLIVYAFPQISLLIPQLSIILSLFTFFFGHFYYLYTKYPENFRFKTLLPALIFSLSSIALLLFYFSKPFFNI